MGKKGMLKADKCAPAYRPPPAAAGRGLAQRSAPPLRPAASADGRRFLPLCAARLQGEGHHVGLPRRPQGRLDDVQREGPPADLLQAEGRRRAGAAPSTSARPFCTGG